MLLSNRVKCHKCGDYISSKHRHDYVECSCGNIAVDGGQEYRRRAGPGILDNSFDDLSIYMNEDVAIHAWQALDWCDRTKRNNFGRLCAVMMVLKEAGYDV